MKDLINIFRKNTTGGFRDDIRTFWHLSKPYTWRLIAAGICSLVLSGINGAIAWSIKPALDTIFIDKKMEYLYLLPLGIMILFIMRGVFAYFNNYIMNAIGAKIVKFIRQSLYDKLLVLPMSFHTNTSSSVVVSKLLNDTTVLQNIVGFTIKDFLIESLTVIVLAGVAIYRKWDLALLSFVMIPLILYSIGKLGISIKKISRNTRVLIEKVTFLLQETLQGIKIIKAFTMEQSAKTRYENALSGHYRNIMREVRINELSRLVVEILGGFAIASIIFYGGNLVISNKISSGDFFSFIAAILMMYTPLKRLSQVNNNFQQGRTVIERIKGIISETEERQGGIEKQIKGQIEFKNVSFKYPSRDEYALKNINIKISPGDVVALVGQSGSGKSTLASLILGFWSPSQGEIIIDGVNITEFSLYSLRKQIAVVTQDVILFDDTVKANILFGADSTNNDELINASRMAFADEFIKELPEGYKTQIGEHGAKVSGGQKQRITIARAILRNPAILILDEATSSLDIEAESQVQKAIDNLMKDRTTVIITHILSTLKNATKIIVIDKGEIIEQGTHNELLELGGNYKELLFYGK